MTTAVGLVTRPLLSSLLLFTTAVATQGQSADDSAAQRLVLEAQRFEQQGQIDDALEEYGVLIAEFPESSLAPGALLRAAQLHAQRGETDLAFSTAQRLIDGYGRDQAAAAAWVLQGEVRRAQADSLLDLEEARGLFRRVPLLFPVGSFPGLEARSQALFQAGETSALLGALDEAAAAFIEAIEDEQAPEWKLRARVALASVWLWQGDWPAAADVLQRVAESTASSDSSEQRHLAHLVRERLTLVHRMLIRPQAGQRPWSRARQLGVPGLTIKGATGVAAHDDGRLLIVDDGQQVLLIGPRGEISSRAAWRGAEHPFFGFDAQAYVTVGDAVQSPGASRVVFTVGGEKPRTLEKLRAAQRGIFGDWVVADRSSGGVLLFDRDTRFVRSALEDQLDDVEDVARDARGRLYLLDRKSRSILVAGADGSRLATISLTARKPAAIDVDHLGNIYVLDGGEGTISILANDGTPITRLGPTLPGGSELRAPRDIAVDGAGRLYVADAKLPYVLMVE